MKVSSLAACARNALSTGASAAWRTRDWLFGKDGPRHRRVAGWSCLGLGVAALLYYPVGMVAVNRINDDPWFRTPARFEVKGGSHAAEMVEALIDREVNRTAWVSNDPFFLPGSQLSRMPAFQQGMFYALGRYAQELQEVMGRARGSSSMDTDLEDAQGRIKYPPDIFAWNPATSLLMQSPSTEQYRIALRRLGAWDARLARGQATYDIRGDNLLSLLDRASADIGSLTGEVDRGLAHRSHLWFVPTGFYDPVARDILYRNKGEAYGWYMILRATGEDYQPILKLKNAQDIWDNALAELRKAAIQHPIVVSNTDADEWFFNTHLGTQGYFLSQSRHKLQEVRDVVSK
jgi:hypothetical protein